MASMRAGRVRPSSTPDSIWPRTPILWRRLVRRTIVRRTLTGCSTAIMKAGELPADPAAPLVNLDGTISPAYGTYAMALARLGRPIFEGTVKLLDWYGRASAAFEIAG